MISAPREVDQNVSPHTEPVEPRAERLRRHGRRTGLYSLAFSFVALLIVLVALVAANTRQLKLSWVVGSGHASLVWIILASAVLGWLLGVVTSVVFRLRTRRRRPRHVPGTPSGGDADCAWSTHASTDPSIHASRRSSTPRFLEAAGSPARRISIGSDSSLMFFPGSRRHDSDALVAYEAYLSDVAGRAREADPAPLPMTSDTERWEGEGGRGLCGTGASGIEGARVDELVE